MAKDLQPRNDARQRAHEGELALRKFAFLLRMSGIVVVVYAVAWPTRQILALKKVTEIVPHVVLGIGEGDATHRQFNRSTHRLDLIPSGILASLWNDLLDLTPLLSMFLWILGFQLFEVEQLPADGGQLRRLGQADCLEIWFAIVE